MIVLAGRTDPPVEFGRVVVVGESKVVGWAHRRARRLRARTEVDRVSGVLAEAFPPHPAPLRTARVLPLEPVMPAGQEEAEQQMLPDLADIEQSLLEHALDSCIEEWMTFLHPEQVRLARRIARSGPVRGAAGTGKTVVALHRAAYVAESLPGPVLVTSFIKTLPPVLASLYARLSPSTADRVEFVNLHAWASAPARRAWACTAGSIPGCARTRSTRGPGAARASGPTSPPSACPGRTGRRRSTT